MGNILCSKKGSYSGGNHDDDDDDDDNKGKYISRDEQIEELVDRFGSDATHLASLKDALELESDKLIPLGDGGFSWVKLAESRKYGQVAVKIIPTTPPAKTTKAQTDVVTMAQKREIFQREIDIWRELNPDGNEFILRLVADITTPDYIYIVSNVAHGTVEDTLKGKGLPEGKAKKIFTQASAGLAFMHSKGIAHRDMKPENLLMTKDGNVLLSDFGLATKENPSREFWGTPAFMAPEQAGRFYDPFISDVWQLGVTLYMIMFGILPYRKNEQGFMDRRRSSQFDKEGLEFPRSKMCSMNCKDLIRKMLTENPRNRTELKAVSDHVWIATALTVLQSRQPKEAGSNVSISIDLTKTLEKNANNEKVDF